MLLFRVDGNSSIGSGHIMRCLSIADSATIFKQESCFLTATDEFQNIIEFHGHKNLVLNTNYNDMSMDLELTINALSIYKAAVLFVDSYYVSLSYLALLRDSCRAVGCKLVYIDDILAFAYPCDVLLNYNIYGLDKKEEYQYLYKNSNIEQPSFLLGTVYAPLRYEFQSLSRRVTKREAYNILISTGGADFEHIGIELIKAIRFFQSLTGQYKFHFVIGAMNKDVNEIRWHAKEMNNVILHINEQRMSELMRSVDVAISAAGSTLYELCATQTPTITYILADNQILGANSFEQHHVMKNVGDVRNLGTTKLAQCLIKDAVKLMRNYEERIRISTMQRNIVDGKGAKRIIDSIIA